MFCNKSILVQSNLATDQLKYKTIPGEFVTQPRWNIAIASVAFESNKTLSFPCFVTCNFVTEKLMNDSSELVNYEQPLCSFFFDTKQNSSNKLVRQGKSFSFVVLIIQSTSLVYFFSLYRFLTFLSVSLSLSHFLLMPHSFVKFSYSPASISLTYCLSLSSLYLSLSLFRSLSLSLFIFASFSASNSLLSWFAWLVVIMKSFFRSNVVSN